MTDASNSGWGALCEGRPARLLVQPRAMPKYQLPRNDGGFPGDGSILFLHHARPFRQHDGGGLHKLPGRPKVMVSLQYSETAPTIFLEGTGRAGPKLVCKLFPYRSAPSGHQMN